MEKILPKTYRNPYYAFVPTADFGADKPVRHAVVVVGAGPVGLSAALDLASRGIACVVLSKDNSVSVGSRAICFAKKTLEVVNRFAPHVAKRMLNKGVVWNVGKVFYRDSAVYEFNLLPEDGHKIPAFINLQQYYFEEYLADAAHEHPLIEVRWGSTLSSFEQLNDGVLLHIDTPDGAYNIEADYLVACDGVHSPIRKQLGIVFEGEMFEENFLIADIVMENDFPTERWFWFDPPFNKGRSALLHKQPDGVWRIDLQLGFDIDREKELDPKRITKRLRKMLGKDVKFRLEWTSIYRFRCMRIAEFVHGRVIFAGDSAHLVSPFGARGANGGVQDTDNLIWKLAYVLQNRADSSILSSYQAERSPATDENIFHSTNATDFISPKSEISTLFRNACLDLAKNQPFARRLVNSGRLSTPFCYANSPLTSPDTDTWDTDIVAGSSAKDAAIELEGSVVYFLDLLGNDFTLVCFGPAPKHANMSENKLLKILHIPNTNSSFATRYDLTDGAWMLFRPDHYLAARGRIFDDAGIEKAMQKALGKVDQTTETPQQHGTQTSADELYRALIEKHKGRSKAESDKLNAQLILALMNEIADKSNISALLTTL